MRSPFALSVIGEGSITLDPPQPPEGYCPGTEVTVTAVPDTDWVFREWGAGPVNLEWAPSQTMVPTPGPVDVLAFFDHRPGISSLSMVEDLGAYLVAIGVYTDPGEVENFDYDTGVEDLEGVVTVHLPNGIPDAAELMALQAVMQNPGIETKDSGVSHAMVWQLYQTCLAQAQIDLNAQSAAVQRAVAAYMTLGSFGHVGQVLKDVQTHFSVSLDRSLYPNAGDRWFAANKDMDRDGVTNKEEWDYAVEQSAEAKSGASASATFAGAASDPGGSGGAPPALPDTGSANDFDLSCASWATLKVNPTANSQFDNVTVNARVTLPGGTVNLIIPEGQAVDLPVGVEVQVTASDSGWFKGWNAPETLLDGSDNPSDSFILTGYAEITAQVKGIEGMDYVHTPYEEVSVNVGGGDEPLVVLRSTGFVGDRFIAVREGTLLSAEGRARNYSVTRLKANVDYRNKDTTHWGKKAIIHPGPTELITPQGGVPLHGYGTVSGSAPGGRAFVSQAAPKEITPFADAVRYAIPYAPGSTWQRSTCATFDVGVARYLYSQSKPSATNLNPNPKATATVNAKSVLTLGEAECDGECEMEHHGNVSLENAKRYYLGPRASNPVAELVGVSAVANPGHVLRGLKIEGGGQAWVEDDGEVEDYLSLDGLIPAEPNGDGLYTDEKVYIEMAADATVTPVVVLPTVVNLQCTGEVPSDPHVCQEVGLDATLRATMEWESSTGVLSDLTGIVFEILCYDLSVSFDADILPWLNSENPTFGGMDDPGPDGDPGEDSGFDIDEPWLSLYENGEGGHVLERWKLSAHSNASTGVLVDNHTLTANRAWAGSESQWKTKQYYVHKPECGPIVVIGEYLIERGTHDSPTSFYIKKSGAGCSGDEHTFSCPDWEE